MISHYSGSFVLLQTTTNPIRAKDHDSFVVTNIWPHDIIFKFIYKETKKLDYAMQRYIFLCHTKYIKHTHINIKREFDAIIQSIDIHNDARTTKTVLPLKQ